MPVANQHPQDVQRYFDELMLLYKYNILAFIRDMFGVEPTFQQMLMLADALGGNKARVAIKSCTSSGKTACLAWLILWALAVEDDIRILATAPTFPLLDRVLRTEVEKWHMKMPDIIADMYTITEKKVVRAGNKTHRCDFATASSENEQALAGGHSGNYWIIVDEGAAVGDSVYEVLMGTLSYGSSGRMIIASNPTRSYGFYYNLFATNNKHWKLHTFDAFNTPHVDGAYIQEVRDTYGEDSDFYRVRILGEFPRASSTQFFSTDDVESAMERDYELRSYAQFQKIAGADIARFGDDETVFVTRQGPKITDITSYHGLDTMEVSARLLEYYRQHQHSAVMIDGTGLGAGVVDRCRQYEIPVVDVIVSNRSSNPNQYVNLRSQLYGSLRDWLKNEADIPKEDRVRRQFLSVQYGYNGKMQMQLASKKDIKKLNNGESPDIPDACSYTFAEDSFLTFRGRTMNRQARNVVNADYMWA